MKTNEVEKTLIRYLYFSKARVLAKTQSSDRPNAILRMVISSLTEQNRLCELDEYTSRALYLYSEGVKGNEPLPVILAKIETHRRYVLNVLENSRHRSKQPVRYCYVFCSDNESKIRMLLKHICAQHLRVFLLSFRKSSRKTPKSPRSVAFQCNNEKGSGIAPAA